MEGSKPKFPPPNNRNLGWPLGQNGGEVRAGWADSGEMCDPLCACVIRTACVTYSACVKTVACITVPACSCRTFWLGEGAIWCIYLQTKCGNTRQMWNFWHNFSIKLCCHWQKKRTFSKKLHPSLDHSIQE